MDKTQTNNHKKDYESRNKSYCPIQIKPKLIENLSSDEQKDMKVALGIMNELAILIETDDK